MGRKRRTRRRDKSADNKAAQVAKITQPVHDMMVYEVLDATGVARVNDVSMQILEEIGIDFYDEECLAILKENGATVKGSTVFFDRAIVHEWLAHAPSQFTQIARNPLRNVQIGGNKICFAPVYGPPFVYDRERGRREAKLVDFENFVKLTYMTPYLHHSGGTVCEPTDTERHTRHLDMVYAHIKYSDKPFMGSVTSQLNARQTVEMCEILFGADAIRANPATISLINVSSPRRYDDRMLGALKEYAKSRQGILISPFILSGAMSPVSVASTAAQINAEALAGIVLTQMINPGTPVIYGAFQTNIDLQSGAPVFGSAESQHALYATAQLARYHNLPVRSGGMFASSKVADAQAAYESTIVMQAAMHARINFVLHAAGWLEGGLTAGYEKFVMDCEVLGMMHRFLTPIDLSDEAFAMDSQRTVPPGGHHLGTDHTMKHFREAFFRSDLFDYNSAEQWLEEGGKTSEEVANTRYKKLLREYVAPPLDPAIDEALNDYMARTKPTISHDNGG